MSKFNKSSILLLLAGLYATAMLVLAVLNLRGLNQELNNQRQISIDYSRLHNRAKIANGELVAPLAVMIDGSYGVQPAGLAAAEVVFEVPVEGGVTRLLALFDEDSGVSLIGPVRSVRPYFLDYAAGYKSTLAHAGGSPEALRLLAGSVDQIIDVNEIGPLGRFFWRDNNQSAPHNLYTSAELLKKAKSQLSPEWDENLIINVPPPIVPGLVSNPKITIDFSTDPYKVEYVFQPSGGYRRYRGGQEYAPRIEAQNVLIAFVSVKVIDEVGRLRIQTSGSGDAIICRQGECQTGAWQKKSAADRLGFYLGDEEAALVPGQTWIEIVPIGRTVTY